jgi:hypothetical protein
MRPPGVDSAVGVFTVRNYGECRKTVKLTFRRVAVRGSHPRLALQVRGAAPGLVEIAADPGGARSRCAAAHVRRRYPRRCVKAQRLAVFTRNVRGVRVRHRTVGEMLAAR